MGIISVIFVCLITVFNVYIFEDLIIRKNFLWKKYCTEAEILWFDECALFRRKCNIAVVKYTKYDISQKIIVRRGVKDKIGDKLIIVTNGSIAVRSKIYWKKDLEIPKMILWLIVIVILGKIIFDNIYRYDIRHIVLAFAIIIMFLLIYPLFYEADMNDIKRALGWH